MILSKQPSFVTSAALCSDLITDSWPSILEVTYCVSPENNRSRMRPDFCDVLAKVWEAQRVFLFSKSSAIRMTF